MTIIIAIVLIIFLFSMVKEGGEYILGGIVGTVVGFLILGGITGIVVGFLMGMCFIGKITGG